MALLKWDQPGNRIYETGLDRAVLYLDDNLVVPWNGLIRVDSANGESTEPFFFDGKKYADRQYSGEFAAKISALTYPPEFEDYDGFVELVDGVSVRGQIRKSFGLSYRTLVGDDISDLDLGYKIHIVYNLTASSDDVAYETVDSNVDPFEFSWVVTSRPVIVPGYAPTAHIIADSRYMEPAALQWLEYILYGTDTRDPFLPSISSLFELLDNTFILTVTDNGDGTATVEGPSEYIIDLGSEITRIQGIDGYLVTPTKFSMTST